MIELLFASLLLLVVLPSGGYALARALPRSGLVVAAGVAALLVLLWWLALGDGPGDGSGDGPGFAMGLAILVWLTGIVMLSVIGLVAGAFRKPGLLVGAWVGTLATAILAAWLPARALTDFAPLVFIACCAAGGAWPRGETQQPGA